METPELKDGIKTFYETEKAGEPGYDKTTQKKQASGSLSTKSKAARLLYVSL